MHKILIVEDDPMIAEIYQKKFADSGFQVLMAENGEKALNTLKKETVELVLLDLVMPGMDGFEVIENLRHGNYDQNVKIIVFSNLSQKEDKDRARELGANGFIVKSDYTPNDLVKEVDRLLNQFNEQKVNEEKKEGSKKSDGKKSSAGKKKILMMEDEDVFVDMFGGKLKQDGFDVECVQNGSLGIKKAMENKYDLFVIDIAMPIMNGDEVAERLKSDENLKHIPIVILSASAGDEDAKKLQAIGVEKFLIKTQVTPSELSKEVDTILNS